MKPHFRSFPLFPAAAALAVAGFVSTQAPAAHAQKTSRIGPVAPIDMPAIPISIEAQARSLNVTVEVMGQIQAIRADKETWTQAQQKLDSHLLYAAREAQSGLQVPGRPDIKIDQSVELDNMGRADMIFHAEVTDALLNAIKQAGGEIVFSAAGYKTVRAKLSLVKLESIAARPEVNTVEKYIAPHHNTGSVTSQGDTTHLAAAARTSFGVTGQNTVIGVLSDGDTFLAKSKASGDINANTIVLPGQDGAPGNSGEGTAMMEIVQDIAPKAQLLFATGNGGQAVFANNIRKMYDTYNATVIIDDLFYLAEDPFQDDVVAQAVDYVTSKGVLYFSSAGNQGNLRSNTASAWEGDFVSGPIITDPTGVVSGSVHQYNATTTYNTATIDAGLYAFIHWSDPLNGSTNDYDAFGTNAAGTAITRLGNSVQNGTQSPYEYVTLPVGGERIYIVAKIGAKARALRINAFGDGYAKGLTIVTAGQTFGHSGAAQAYSVAAAPVDYDGNTGQYVGPFPGPFIGTSPVELFSSDGPRQIFYNPDGSAVTPGNFLFGTGGGLSRQKPDIAAADGVNTSASFSATSGLNPFYGTSAAAPHAGAIAGLVKSMNGMAGSTFISGPLLTSSEMYTTLTGSAVDVGVAGLDVNAGYGIVMAQPALNFLKNLTKNVTISNLRNTTATISWKTNLPTSSTFTYGGGTSSGGTTITDPTISTTHTVTLGGLTMGTKYAFSIGASTPTGSVVYNSPADQFFTTTGISPTTTLGISATASAIKSGKDVIVSVSIVNTGSGIANGITITAATLNNIDTNSVVPFVIGSGLYPGATLPAPVRFVYPTGGKPGDFAIVSITGKLSNGPTFSGTATVRLP